jgi:hypothetical protein
MLWCLSVVAAEWLGAFSVAEKVELFHSFFSSAPAPVLLPILTM